MDRKTPPGRFATKRDYEHLDLADMTGENQQNPEAEAATSNPTEADKTSTQPLRKPDIKIGSQRDLKPTPRTAAFDRKHPAEPVADAADTEAADTGAADTEAEASKTSTGDAGPDDKLDHSEPSETLDRDQPSPPPVTAEQIFPPPRAQRVSAELQQEIDDALSDISIEDLMSDKRESTESTAAIIQLDQPCVGRVLKCDREYVFLSLGDQHEGIAARRHFAELPELGSEVEVVPTRFLAEENLYEVVVPGASVDVQDWSDIADGMTIEVRITGHNKGGLECEVNHIRGFIPISHVSIYRVEDLEPYVGQSLQCVVTESNADRRNLVLSHRAVLEREREQAREKLLQELEVGQTREGIVRRLQDFGAFVDIGGIDGLIHISQLSWDRVNHPSDVLEEGQKVQVRIDKIDPASGRIGLSYRDLLEDPWQDAESKFAVGSVIDATVAKIMDFGAFVKLAPGVDGLVHISEIAHHRVHTVSAFLKEGQPVQVKVLSIDAENQRLSLSIKEVQAVPAKDSADEDQDPELTQQVVAERKGPLKGGLGRKTGGDQFGLNW